MDSKKEVDIEQINLGIAKYLESEDESDLTTLVKQTKNAKKKYVYEAILKNLLRPDVDFEIAKGLLKKISTFFPKGSIQGG